MRTKEETEKIALADDLRDKALEAFGIALTETYDLKSIRMEMFRRYSEFCDYVLAMAKVLDMLLFVTMLNLLNTARNYYADMLAKRPAVKADETTPAK